MKRLQIIKHELMLLFSKVKKKYTKYNHVLGNLEMTQIPPKKKERLKSMLHFLLM